MSPCARSCAAQDFAEGTREEFTSTTAGPSAAADEKHTPGVKAQEEASEGGSTCLFHTAHSISFLVWFNCVAAGGYFQHSTLHLGSSFKCVLIEVGAEGFSKWEGGEKESRGEKGRQTEQQRGSPPERRQRTEMRSSHWILVILGFQCLSCECNTTCFHLSCLSRSEFVCWGELGMWVKTSSDSAKLWAHFQFFNRGSWGWKIYSVLSCSPSPIIVCWCLFFTALSNENILMSRIQ